MFTACGIMHQRCCPKQDELIEIINKPLLLHPVGYLHNGQMGFNSVFRGLKWFLTKQKWEVVNCFTWLMTVTSSRVL